MTHGTAEKKFRCTTGKGVNMNYYQPMPNYRPMPQPLVPQQMIPQQEEILYVPNQQAAEAYLMAPNSFVRLWDAQVPRFYEKRTDPQGRPFPMDVYEFHKVTDEPKRDEIDMSEQFVTRKEFDELRAKLEPKKKKGEESNG